MSVRPVSVHLPSEVVEALDNLSKREDRSRSRLVLRYVRRGLEAEGFLPADAASKSPSEARNGR